MVARQYFSLEHQQCTTSWTEEGVLRLTKEPGVIDMDLDQCRSRMGARQEADEETDQSARTMLT